RLLKRVFDIDIEHCPNCGDALKIIAAIEDPPVIIKILSHLGLPTRSPPRAPARRVDLFQTIEEPKTTCQRKPPAPLTLSPIERRDRQPRAHLRSPRRPRPCHPRPNKAATLTQLSRLDRPGALAIYLRSSQRWFKNPIHLECRARPIGGVGSTGGQP